MQLGLVGKGDVGVTFGWEYLYSKTQTYNDKTLDGNTYTITMSENGTAYCHTNIKLEAYVDIKNVRIAVVNYTLGPFGMIVSYRM